MRAMRKKMKTSGKSCVINWACLYTIAVIVCHILLFCSSIRFSAVPITHLGSLLYIRAGIGAWLLRQEVSWRQIQWHDISILPC